MSQAGILEETRREKFVNWFKRIFKKKAVEKDIELRVHYLHETVMQFHKEHETKLNVLVIAKGRDFMTSDHDYCWDTPAWRSNDSLKKDDCVLAGVALPLKWVVWVKKCQ